MNFPAHIVKQDEEKRLIEEAKERLYRQHHPQDDEEEEVEYEEYEEEMEVEEEGEDEYEEESPEPVVVKRRIFDDSEIRGQGKYKKFESSSSSSSEDEVGTNKSSFISNLKSFMSNIH